MSVALGLPAAAAAAGPAPGGRGWVSDEDRRDCTTCSRTFSVLLRRHHCRACGDVFCGACSAFESLLPGHAGRVRVCGRCVARHANVRSPAAAAAAAMTGGGSIAPLGSPVASARRGGGGGGGGGGTPGRPPSHHPAQPPSTPVFASPPRHAGRRLPAAPASSPLPWAAAMSPLRGPAPPAAGAPVALWVPDALAPACMACGGEFTLFRRRHHCRRCGIVCCDGCAPLRGGDAADGGPGAGGARLCDACVSGGDAGGGGGGWAGGLPDAALAAAAGFLRARDLAALACVSGYAFPVCMPPSVRLTRARARVCVCASVPCRATCRDMRARLTGNDAGPWRARTAALRQLEWCACARAHVRGGGGGAHGRACARVE